VLPPLATQDEVFASNRRNHDVESANFAGVPVWAQALQQQMANFANNLTVQMNKLTDQMNNLTDQMNNHTVQMKNLTDQMNNIEARQVNSVAIDPWDPLRALTNQDGDVYVNFPDTLQALNGLNGVEMTALLTHYGAAVGGANQTKLHRIKKFIGMRTS
jgi:Protein of unknown function (DUF3294)